MFQMGAAFLDKFTAFFHGKERIFCRIDRHCDDHPVKKLTGAGYEDHKAMFADLKAAYQTLCERVNAVGIIPSGELFQKMLANGFETVHRDTYHATRGAGRYALALLWYRMLTGADVTDNTFCDFDEEVTPEQMQTIKTLVQAFQPLNLK